ncbi:MAG: MOSC domain-containing protein [Erythrobacter sp.]|nr:MOSC domain-containing protein [Erythrobacter sp.]
MSWKVEALLAGVPLPFRGEELSAFAKVPLAGPVRVTREGLVGDHQADRKHHGGPHMAVHIYPLDHHPFWQRELGGHELLAQPGAFGSNLAIRNLDETMVRIGDRFRLGSALVEVSQPRMPCWKIEHRFGQKGMVATIIETARCGWYFRVIEEGVAKAGDMLELDEGDRTPWTLAEVFTAIANPRAQTSAPRLLAMGDCELLAPQWREKARRKAEGMGGA